MQKLLDAWWWMEPLEDKEPCGELVLNSRCFTPQKDPLIVLRRYPFGIGPCKGILLEEMLDTGRTLSYLFPLGAGQLGIRGQ